MSAPRFKRMIIGLPQGMGNPSAVSAAVDLAESLQIELLAGFIADAALLELCDFPAVRELRLLERQWRPLDAARMSGDLADLAEVARKRFVESIGGRAIRTSFDVLSGIQGMASLIETGDIVAIIEPAHPGECITRQFTDFIRAAFAAATAILVVPRRIVRACGPVVALASDADDPTIVVALQIASVLKEPLIVVAPPSAGLPAEVAADAARLGVALEQVAAGAPEMHISPFSRRTYAKERLRVVSRPRVNGGPVLFSMLQGIPLLVLDPDHE